MKRWISLVLAMFLLGTACACSGHTKTDSSVQEQDTSQTAPPLLSVDLATLLTPEQIGDAIGDTVGAPQMYESNTWAHYTGVHSATTVDISLDETSRAVFDARADLYPNKAEVPFLGDVSWWDTATGELLTYGD